MAQVAQLYYEDVQVGAEITPLVKAPTTQQLVRYAGASGDFHRIHYDDPYARSLGFPGVIVHGLLKSACLGQMLTDWAGPRSWVKKIGTEWRRIDVPGDTLTCKGRVTNKYVENGEHLVELEIWTENGTGQTTTLGKATVRLPSRQEVAS